MWYCWLNKPAAKVLLSLGKLGTFSAAFVLSARPSAPTLVVPPHTVSGHPSQSREETNETGRIVMVETQASGSALLARVVIC